MKEEWKDIEGFEGQYQISNFGNVKSVEREVRYQNTNQTGVVFEGVKYCPERMLKKSIIRGYAVINLKKNGKGKNYSIHRLVATYFITNPDPIHFNEINHKDENKLNNVFTNLEWCDSKYNNNYGTRNKRIKEKLLNHPNYYIPVLCYDLENNFIKRYESAEQAAQELGISGSGITACCKLYSGRASAGGYKWKYEDSDVNIEDIIYEPQKKIVHQFDIDGNYLNTFESISEAAKKNGKDIHNFAHAIKKTLAYNYVWIVGDDKDNYQKVDRFLKELYEKQHHIYQIDSDGKVVNRFKSGLEAEAKTGVNHSNISHAMLSKTKEGKLFRKSGGFYWVDINLDPTYEIDFKFKKGHGETKVIQCDRNGKVLREFESVAEAQEFLGLPRNKQSSIYDCLNKTGRYTAYGFIWKKK